MRNPPFRKRIIAIGGGKGGVGKSTLAAGLGMAIGTMKRRTLLVDADFSSSNLHTVCGIARPTVTLNVYLNNRRIPLEEVIVPVDEYTRLLSGAGSLLSLNGPTFKQREALFRSLNQLDFNSIVVDLPAGTGRELIDFFTIAYNRIIVMEPTPLSIENAYLFLKNMVYRRLLRVCYRLSECKAMFCEEVMENRSSRITGIQDLMNWLAQFKPAEIAQLEKENQQCHYWLIMNKVRNGNARSVAANFCTVSDEHLGISVQPLATIDEDPSVLQSLYSRDSMVHRYPDSPFIQTMKKAAETLFSHTDSQE